MDTITVSVSQRAIHSYSPEPRRALGPKCRHFSFLRLAVTVAVTTAFIPTSGHSQGAGPNEWIDTWTASPQPVWDAEFFAPVNIPRALRNQTVRQIAALSIGGNRVRVVLSNEYGSKR